MPFLQSESSSSETCKKRSFGFPGKLPHPFWKSKSKGSVCSESQGSDLNSPPFTPDSSLSIYTNSLDSDCSTHSSTNSNQVSPKNSTAPRKKVSALEDQLSTYSYNNDCARYAANMYYDMGDSSSFECRVPIDPPRNTVPTTPPFENDCVHSYYNNSTFTTFPSSRRHSVGYSSYSSSLSSNQSHSSGNKREEMMELLPIPPCSPGQDGYLIPISGSASRRFNRKNFYVNDCVTNAVVEVDVHVSEPSERGMSSIEESLGLGEGSRTDSYSLSTGDSLPASNDSGSTATIVSPMEQAWISSKEKMTPLCMSRILLASSDCEPFCSLCAATAVTTSKKTTIMDVAIISCQECFFSRVISDKVRVFFERMVTPDNHRIDITLQVYDLRDLDNHAVAAEVHRAKVQIVIISNHFLERLRHEASSRKKLSPVNRALRSKRVIAIITGTTAAEISEGNQAVLVRFDEWFTLELRSASKMDAEFCKKFTDQVVKIYNVELSNNSNFSVFPKKATREQPKIVIMLKKPVGSEDSIRIEFTKGRDSAVLTNVAPTNPYTAVIRIPETLCAERTSLLEIAVFVNQQKLGTKLVKYEFQAKASEEDIIEKMTKAVPGFQKLLDDHISQTLSKNFRACTDWSLDPELELMNDVLVSKGDDFPTLMHFSAYYGLEQTVWTLLDEADGFEQCSLYNDVNETPLDVAQGNVGQIIKDYQEMAMSCRAFQYVKDLVARNSNDGSKILGAVNGETSITHDRDETNGTEGIQSELHYSELDPSSEVDAEEILEEVEVETVGVEDEEHPTETPVKAEDVTNVEKLAPVEISYTNITTQLMAPGRDKNMRGKPPPSTLQREHLQDSKVSLDSNYVNEDAFSGSGNVPSAHYTEVTESLPSNPIGLRKASRADENYDIPRLETYQIPPPGARPVVPEKPLVVSSPQLRDSVRSDSSGYIPMSSTENNNHVHDRPLEAFMKGLLHDNSQVYPVPLANSVGQVLTGTVDSRNEDLAEIMSEFKNNVNSVNQLELLFEHWKRLNEGKMSYQERQSRLKQMRSEYNQIQDKLNKGQRRPSVLDKVLHFFNTGRKKPRSSISSAWEGSSLDSELSGRDFSLNGNRRKISITSDRGSIGSSSTGISDPESLASSRDRQLPWVDPLTSKCVVSYVEPQVKPDSSQSQLDRSAPVLSTLPENFHNSGGPPHYYKEPPPPRPFKPKTDLPSINSSEGTSPPRSPKSYLKKVGKGVLCTEKASPPPLPPPRTEKGSPIRRMYGRRPSDASVPWDTRNEGGLVEPVGNGLSNFVQPYENTRSDGGPLSDSKKS